MYVCVEVGGELFLISSPIVIMNINNVQES